MDLQFGVYLHPPGGSADPRDLARLAEGAERLGFDSVWLGDHVAWPARFDPVHHHDVGGRTPPPAVVHANVFEPMTTLSWLAGQVRRIRLGVGVLVAPYRNAVLGAKMLAMVDVLSGGRLVAGVGAGWLREEFTMLGSPPFEERGRVTEDCIRAFVELWTRDGDVLVNPKPVQRPHPPVWVGGNGLPAMRRAAALGQGWMPLHQTPDQMAAKVRRLGELAETGGRARRDLTIALGCRFHLSAAGDAAVAPEPDALTGTSEQLRDQLRRYQEAGVDEVHLLGERYASVDELLDAWERLAGDVLVEV